jgi:ATP-dependent Clp protease ATP-binding subunit ClpB
MYWLSGDLAKAGELRHATIPRLEDELDAWDKKENEVGNQHKMLSDFVSADAIATVVARLTGIPVSRITGSESRKLLKLEDQLRQRVVGQDAALSAVSDCVRLARTRLQAQDRPLGNFLFIGPTGVGKTELCKALAESLFDDESAMTRIDMSEYGEKHTVSRLIGAPPGYVGYEEGGTLTESVRRRPYQILLLDEFEKGHKAVWNILLQLFDEGHLTDSHGRKVDFRNCIVVMTSNIGASVIAELPPDLTGSEPHVRDALMEVVRGTLSPELLNRIDETVVFNRLQRENMGDIAKIHLDEITQRLMEGQNMTLDVSEVALDCIAEKGYDIRYGARPLKRVLARDILNPLSKLLLEGSVKEGETVKVRTRGEAKLIAKSSPDDILILRNHEVNTGNADENETSWDDDEFLLEDGTHAHR